jgi:hypothetical protein
MDVVRVFETRVSDRESGASLSCLSLLRSDWKDAKGPHWTAGDVAGSFTGDLGLDVIESFGPSALPFGVMGLLTSENADEFRAFAETGRMTNPREFFAQVDPAGLYEFAEYVVYAPLVTFEASPPVVGSLATIAGTAGTVGLGGTVGFAAVGVTPLVFLAVPAGIIVVGVAAAVSQGLRYHILRWMGVPDGDGNDESD